jgi:hypothetical protein
MTGFFQDIRYSLLQLRKSPTFTATIIFSLALGIGAHKAIFSVINAVMLRSLPVQGSHGPGVIKPNQDDDDTVTSPMREEVRDKRKAFPETIRCNAIGHGFGSSCSRDIHRRVHSGAPLGKGASVSGAAVPVICRKGL